MVDAQDLIEQIERRESKVKGQRRVIIERAAPPIKKLTKKERREVREFGKSPGLFGLGLRKRGVKGAGRRLKDLALPTPRSEREFSRTLLGRKRRTFEKIIQSQASPVAKARARIMLEKLR